MRHILLSLFLCLSWFTGSGQVPNTKCNAPFMGTWYMLKFASRYYAEDGTLIKEEQEEHRRDSFWLIINDKEVRYDMVGCEAPQPFFYYTCKGDTLAPAEVTSKVFISNQKLVLQFPRVIVAAPSPDSTATVKESTMVFVR